LLDRIASALGAAHERGIVHRDLKPSNVFLRGGLVEDAVLLDFGIARIASRTLGASLTATDAVIGTPNYMSPEQARGDRDIGPAADLFSLGSLFFECLTGRPPFAADRAMAVLAKIVFEEAPRLSNVWREAPAPLDDLVARLLSKDPAARPASAAALREALAALGSLSFGTGPTNAQPSALSGPEHQILSVVLAAPASSAGPGLSSEHFAALRAALARHDSRIEPLADGSIVITFGQTERAAATDRAAQAARCALLIKEQVPEARVAIATGRGVLQGGTTGGSALDRAAELLDATPHDRAAPDPDPPIWIDEVTAGLIEASFALRDAGGRRRQLLAELVGLDPTRPLLGKPTPYVGRELDLSALLAAFTSAIEEPGARVVVVRAPPGMGKSRLRHEFLRRAAAQAPDIIVLIVRCDLMSAGSSHGLLGRMVCQLAGALEGTPPDEIRQRLVAWANERLPAADAPRVAAFLGELCGAPFPDEHPALHSARQDAGLMAEQITAAFTTILRVECTERPLLLFLEDLHWGDKPTVRAVGAALRELAALPFFVLALARPEIDDLFPRLWEEHGPTNLTLRALGRRACERLCRDVLGPSVPQATLDRIIEQSGGNALFLEELIRAVADGKGETLPESVLAMLQARLMRLAPEARRVLRAASVFGETFWCGGICALLGHASSEGVDAWLAALIEAELVVRDRESGDASELAYRFRHALMRDAAYSMLVEGDRTAAHRAAGSFLEATGEHDPMILAQHFALGQDGARAGAHYARAAEQAQTRGDASAVIARAEMAVAQDVPEHVRARMLALIAEELGWKEDFKSAGAVAAEVLRLSPPGSVPWATAIAPLTFSLLLRGQRGAADEILDQVCAIVPERAALAKVAFGLIGGVLWSYLDGDPRWSTRLLARQRELVDPIAHEEPLAHAWRCLTHACHDMISDAGPASALRLARQGWKCFHAIHHHRGELLTQVYIGKSLWMMGQFEEADHALQSTVVAGVNYGPFEIDRRSCLVDVLIARGRADEAARSAEASLATLERRDEVEIIGEGAVRVSYATALCALGALDRAEEEARAACDLLRLAAGVRLSALAALAAVLLRRGRAEEALRCATEAAEGHTSRRFHGPRHAQAHLIRAEALLALGDPGGARAAITAAREVLQERTSRIDDPELRRSFLYRIADHARVLELCEQTDASPS
jgi:tetratricopeptide (TPR) repeat protein